jgi:hypothetical protein
MRISEPKRKEVTRGQRTLHSERLYNSYSSLKIIRVIKSRRMNWAGHLICTKMRNVHKIFISKHERRPWCRWEDNIKMDLKEIMCDGIEWIQLIQQRIFFEQMNISFPRTTLLHGASYLFTCR